MYCPKCGTKNNESVNFCRNCGASISMRNQNDLTSVLKSDGTDTLGSDKKYSKYLKIIAITNIVLGAILFLLSSGSEDDWTLAPYALGIGICVTGILQLLKKKQKVISILQIIMGALGVLVSLEMTYDWEYVGFVAGAGLLVLGILRVLNKPLKIISIVEIVFGGVSILLGLACIDWAWGDTGLFVGAAFLVEGILSFKENN